MVRTIAVAVAPQSPAVLCAGSWKIHSAPQRQTESDKDNAGTTSAPSPPECAVDSHTLRWLDGLSAVFRVFFGISGVIR